VARARAAAEQEDLGEGDEDRAALDRFLEVAPAEPGRRATGLEALGTLPGTGTDHAIRGIGARVGAGPPVPNVRCARSRCGPLRHLTDQLTRTTSRDGAVRAIVQTEKAGSEDSDLRGLR